MIVMDLIGTPMQSEIISPADTSTGITPAKLIGTNGEQAKAALVTVEDQTLNYTLDGTAAAAGSGAGHQGVAELNLVLRGIDAVKGFRCIDRVSGTTSTIKVTVFF